MPFSTRLTLAQEAGLILPETPIAVFGATPESDLSALPQAIVVSRDARVHARWPDAVETPPEDSAAAVVLLAREKARARDDLARAARCTQGLLIVDGQKTDGIEPMLKALRSRAGMDGIVAKAHGKLLWCDTAPDLSEWRAAALSVDGLRSWPGVFSAARVDPGSALLAAALPASLGPAVCDLGAGWGWLSARIAGRLADRVTDLHMVETDGWALDCARANVPSANAHWADVTEWQSPRRFDSVVMNPPFHEGRKGVPDLGRAFIAKAAEILTPTGRLYMVANRHLPYEQALGQAFAEVDEIGGDGRFKLIRAGRPAAGNARSKAPRTVQRNARENTTDPAGTRRARTLTRSRR